MALYQKYRPKTLDEVYGNDGTIASLQSILEKEWEDIPHAFLFTGPSGCGKTTLGRILATELGCDESEYVEINSADFRGIDMVRDLRVTMRYLPATGNCKFILIDESHKLSNDAQNALLKLLEDTPSHVILALATTEPEKLLKTIRTRCLEYNVESLSEDDLAHLVRDVAKREKIELDAKYVRMIAEKSRGSARQALVLLDQIIGLQEKEIKEVLARVEELESTVKDLCQQIVRGAPWKTLSKILEGIKGEDPERVRLAVLGYCASCMVRGKVDVYPILDSFRDPLFTNGWPGLVLYTFEALNYEVENE